MEDKLMTLVETCEYLKMGMSTVYKLAREGRVPAKKIGGQWRFNKGQIEKWMEGYKNTRKEIRVRKTKYPKGKKI